MRHRLNDIRVLTMGWWRKRAGRVLVLAMLALPTGLVAVLSACGESTADEFVGTWRRSDYKTEWSPPLVIEKTDDGYRATLLYNAGQQPCLELRRHGDTLKGTTSSDRGEANVELIYEGESGGVAPL